MRDESYKAENTDEIVWLRLNIFTPLFIMMNVWELRKVEEPELTKRLGKDYAEYKARVPMFFPCLTKKA